VTSAILVGLLLIVWAQVVSRYVFNNSLAWTEEAARYLMIWGVLLGVNLAFLRGYLISINFITEKLPERVQVVMRLVRKLFALFYTGILAYYGVFLTLLGTKMESPAMGLQYTWVFAAVPTGAAFLFILFLFRRV
jgi:TRAP-type C4-dicarboxylate transport system permease small subunit